MLDFILATAEETEVVDSKAGLGVGAWALIIVVAVILLWMAYLYINSRQSRSAAAEAAPPNLSPGASDDELENKRLTAVLRAALFGSALLAISLPWYAFNEPDRQVEAASEILAADVEAGAHYFSREGFQCANCHGPSGGGGGAAFEEPRSKVNTTWTAPSLDDIFFRYADDEVRYWIEYGRAGTPMPAWGLVGGGAMTGQEIDQTMAYIRSIQVDQATAFGRSESAAALALARMANGTVTTQSLINKQTAAIADVNAAPDKIAVVGGYPDEVADLLQGPGTCTDASAALVNATCSSPGQDLDRDGLADAAEVRLTDIATSAMETITVTVENVPPAQPGQPPLPNMYVPGPNTAYDLSFDPFAAFTNSNPDTRAPEPDLDAADTLLNLLRNDVLVINVTAERGDDFLAKLRPGLEFLQTALEEQPWMVDTAAAADYMGVSVEDATMAVGLFNAYCARCHTGGYSAGPSFERGAGSGAWGPSLRNGRAVTQFPDMADQVKFVISGSENAKGYGTNGIGTGRMPSFGALLSERQIELIVAYTRGL